MTDPIAIFHQWLDQARQAGLTEPNAMALATVDDQGKPAVRMVLLKHADEHGFVFYTNTESDKGLQLARNPFAELCFHWNPPGRQIRVRGPVTRVSDAEADAYFESRPFLSRVGAWASKQSRPLNGFATLEREVALTSVRFATGSVPRPPHWTGFRVAPEMIELWTAKPFRIHDRVRYARTRDGGWHSQPLYP